MMDAEIKRMDGDFFERAKRIIRALPDRILLGLSGGADSVALLRLLITEGKNIFPVHCNFHLRGDESDRDEKFCRKLCAESGLELIVASFDARRVAEERKISIEMACRDLRYDFFRHEMQRLDCDRIAVAHHADDNIETLFLNLMRGCGISGVRGMKPDTGEIVRPFLDFSREDILSYLQSIGQDYIIDSTNADSTPQRNFIRNEVLPLLESRWPSARRSLSRSIRNLRDAEAIYLKGADSDSDVVFGLSDYTAEEEGRLHEFLKNKGISRSIEDEIHSAVRTEKCGQIWRAKDGQLWKGSHALCYIPDSLLSAKIPAFEIVPASFPPRVPNDTESDCMIYLPGEEDDYEWKICTSADKFRPAGMSGKQTIGKILREAGVPQPLRSSVHALYHKKDNTPVWIPAIKKSGGLDNINSTEKGIYIRIITPPEYLHYLKKSVKNSV